MTITFKRPTLYAFDPQTKEYRGTASPDICMASLGRDVLEFLAPAFTTEIAPPDVPRGSVAVWNGTVWTLVADHRGEVWWLGEQPVTITDLSDPVAAGLTKEKPVPPQPEPENPIVIRKRELQQKLNDVVQQGSSYVALKQPVPDDILSEQDALVKQIRKIDKC